MDTLHKWVIFSLCTLGIAYVLWYLTDDDEDNAPSSKTSKKYSTFIPTHEWQEVKPNQAIPPV